MSDQEKKTINDILLAATELGHRLFRQNVGMGWIGKSTRIAKPGYVQVNEGDVVIRKARPLHAGLMKGSSDILGWTPVEVTADMVGKRVAIFTSIEVKTKGVPTTDEQKNWIKAVQVAGGIGAVVMTEDQYRDAVKNWPPKV